MSDTPKLPTSEDDVATEEAEQAKAPQPDPPPRRPERLFDYPHRWHEP